MAIENTQLITDATGTTAVSADLGGRAGSGALRVVISGSEGNASAYVVVVQYPEDPNYYMLLNDTITVPAAPQTIDYGVVEWTDKLYASIRVVVNSNNGTVNAYLSAGDPALA